MKLNVNYDKLHELKERLNNYRCDINNLMTLSYTEVQILNQLLTATENDYYPSKEELNSQRTRVQTFEKIPRWKSIIDECNDFENKYCKGEFNFEEKIV